MRPAAQIFIGNIVIELEGVVDIPNAFSPNSDGSNDILFIEGFGIKWMELQVFNRWGELVFRSIDISDGWNGKFRSKDQDMDVYAYILKVEFLDGEKVEKKGNITLLR